MFGFKKRTATATAAAVETLEPVPVPIPPALAHDQKMQDEYNRIAKKIGLQELVRSDCSELAAVLAEEHIGAYDQAKVEAHMDKQGYWKWWPLREADRNFLVTHWQLSKVGFVRRASSHEFPQLYGRTELSLYDASIPMPVLLTVEKLLDRLPDSLCFMVAAIGGDPFLGVIHKKDPNRTIFIIERWDEPTFRR